MATNEFENLFKAKCSLTIMACGMKLKGVKVQDIAEKVKAPKGNWRSKSLMRWVEEKMFLMSGVIVKQEMS